MSICYCDRHNRHWDSDFLENCPKCEEIEVYCQRCEKFVVPIDDDGDNLCPNCKLMI